MAIKQWKRRTKRRRGYSLTLTKRARRLMTSSGLNYSKLAISTASRNSRKHLQKARQS